MTEQPPPNDLAALPAELPTPIDDGACQHLPGVRLPSIKLVATNGTAVDLSVLPGRSVVFCYPRTGQPGVPLPTGWDDIPGARGCTPQSCAFRDLSTTFDSLDVRLFGLSTQDTHYQQEAATRLHLPYLLLSDAEQRFSQTLKLPQFNVDGMSLIKRLTLVIRHGIIERVFYPVFPPDKNAEDVLAWLNTEQ